MYQFQIDIAINIRACYVKVEDDGMHLCYLSLSLSLCFFLAKKSWRGYHFKKIIAILYKSQVVVLHEMNWFSWEKNIVSQNYYYLFACLFQFSCWWYCFCHFTLHCCKRCNIKKWFSGCSSYSLMPDVEYGVIDLLRT